MRKTAALAAASVLVAASASGGSETTIEWLGEATVSREAPGVQGPVGGLSGWFYDVHTESYYAISDDRSRFAPARFYRLTIDLGGGRLEEGDVRVVDSTLLRRMDGSTYALGTIDPEGIAPGPDGSWWVASEGNVEEGIGVSLDRYDAGGRRLEELPVPKAFGPREGSGVRHNLGFESATVTPDGRWLFTATENALVQDGDRATPQVGSPSRLLRFDLERARLESTYLYRTEPIAEAPQGDAFAVNGLVELLALSAERLLALERSFTAGRGNVARIFEIDLSSAARMGRWWRRLLRLPADPAEKRLVLDLAQLGVVPDNVEGMTFGPELPDGRRTLLLIADDNFNPGRQRNQVLAFAIGEAAAAR